MSQVTVNALMRLTKIKFNRVVPAHILEDINTAYGKQFSTCPLLGVTVKFHECNGEPFLVTFRMNGATIASGGGGHMAPGPFITLGEELRAYLMHVADEAFAIVAPIVHMH